MVECERVTSCGEIRVSAQALVVGLYQAIKAANGTCSVREAKIAARAIGATFSNTDAASWLSDVNAASNLPRSKSGRFESRGPQPDRKAAAPTDRTPDHGADRSEDVLADRINAAFADRDLRENRTANDDRSWTAKDEGPRNTVRTAARTAKPKLIRTASRASERELDLIPGLETSNSSSSKLASPVSPPPPCSPPAPSLPPTPIDELKARRDPLLTEPYGFAAWFFDESMRLEQRSAHYKRPDVRRKNIQEDLEAAEVLLDNPIAELQARARRFFAARETGDIRDLETTVRNLLRVWDWGCVRLSASERQTIAKRRMPPERPGSVVKTISAEDRR